jgi:RecB family exonuclease
MPITGIHVLNHIDEIGPGYDGVWAVGFSDRAWPERRRPNPLLPRALQARHRLPWSSPEDALARSRRSIARVSAIAPEVILSWSQHDSEAERLPSPLIKALAEAEPERRGLHGPSRSRDDGRNELVTLADPAPALAERRVPGGAGTLNQQARCPVRAFVERRLGAKPLIPWTRGVSARLRGIIVHDAAARLLSTQLTRSALAAMTTAQLADRIETSANRALERAFGRLRSHLKTVHDLEHERLVRTLRKLVDAELARGDFEIVASESKAIITLGEWEIHARLDRLDRLATGGLAIIDYKTGTNASPDWFGPVLGDAQVPLYALHVGPEVTAAVLCSVSHDGARYRGYWLGQTAFPGSSQSQSMTWPELLARWSSQLEDLTAAFAAGDVRIRLDNAKDVEGLLAPLTRIYELRALCAAEDA